MADEKKVGSKKEVHPERTGTWFFWKDIDDKAFLQIRIGELGEISQGQLLLKYKELADNTHKNP